MNIKDAENQLKQADSLLTTLTNLLKKHWLILLILLAGAGAYTYWELSGDEETVQTEQAPADGTADQPAEEASSQPADNTESTSSGNASDAPAEDAGNSSDGSGENPADGGGQ